MSDYIVTAKANFKQDMPVGELSEKLKSQLESMDLSPWNDHDMKAVGVEFHSIKSTMEFGILFDVIMKGHKGPVEAINSFLEEMTDDLEWEGQRPNEILVEGVRKQ